MLRGMVTTAVGLWAGWAAGAGHGSYLQGGPELLGVVELAVRLDGIQGQHDEHGYRQRLRRLRLRAFIASSHAVERLGMPPPCR